MSTWEIQADEMKTSAELQVCNSSLFKDPSRNEKGNSGLINS